VVDPALEDLRNFVHKVLQPVGKPEQPKVADTTPDVSKPSVEVDPTGMSQAEGTVIPTAGVVPPNPRKQLLKKMLAKKAMSPGFHFGNDGWFVNWRNGERTFF